MVLFVILIKQIGHISRNCDLNSNIKTKPMTMKHHRLKQHRPKQHRLSQTMNMQTWLKLKILYNLSWLMYNSFRWKANRLFNCLPMYIRSSSSCLTIVFKKRLDKFLSSIEDDPITSHFSNSLDQLRGYSCGE